MEARLASGASFYGMMASTGWGAMTHAMEDVAKADLILLVGADVYHDNLIFSNKMREAMRFNDAKIIVVDPRRTKWEQWADLWLRPLPGTDIAWINGLIRLLIEKGVTSREFIDSKTEGFEDLRSSLETFSPDFVKEDHGNLTARPGGVGEALCLGQEAGDRLRLRRDPAPSRNRDRQGSVQSRPVDRRDGRGRRRGLPDAHPEQCPGRLRYGQLFRIPSGPCQD